MKDILKLSISNAVGKAPKTVIIADRTWAAGIPAQARSVLPDLQLLPLAPRDVPDRGQLRDAELLVLEVDADEHATLDRLEAIKRMFPDLPIIAAVRNADIQVMRTLLRHGVSDVVALPFDAEALIAEIFNIGAKLAEDSEVPLAPVVSFVGALGRTGTSSIMLHLANALVEQAANPIRCCLIDLDLQSGELAAHAGLDNARSIQSLLEADARLDQDMIRNVATKCRDGLYIIASPAEILPIEQIDVDQVLRIIALARAQFDLVFIDLPPAWTSWSLSVVAESDSVVFVTQQTLAHLRQARRTMDLFGEVGIRRDKVRLVVNCAAKGRFRNISLQDVADTLGGEVIAAIREDRGELAQATDEGRLVGDLSRKASFARDIDDLARALGPMLAPAKARRGR